MYLQGRNLCTEMQGEDVRLLLSELRQIGFSVDDEKRFFDEATRIGALSSQRRNWSEASSELEKQRVELSDPDVNTLKSKPETDEEPQAFVIHEQIDHQECRQGLMSLRGGLGKGGRIVAQLSRNHP